MLLFFSFNPNCVSWDGQSWSVEEHSHCVSNHRLSRKVKHGPDMMVLIERAFIAHSVYTPYRQQHGNPSANGERAAFEKLDLTR
jgi:hypothetical protein